MKMRFTRLDASSFIGAIQWHPTTGTCISCDQPRSTGHSPMCPIPLLSTSGRTQGRGGKEPRHRPLYEVRTRRTSLRASQGDMARLLSVTQAHYSQLERGHSPLRRDHAARIAKRLGMTLAEIYGSDSNIPVDFNNPSSSSAEVIPL